MIQKTADKRMGVLVLLLWGMLLALVPQASSQAFGCCANPAIGAQAVCNSDSLVTVDQCCPNPSTSPEAYQGPNNPNGPVDKDQCEAEFFDSSCDDLLLCTDVACCVSPEQGGQLLARALCLGAEQTFDSSITDSATCQDTYPVPLCNDGKDNDGDGCADALDEGCFNNGQYNPADNSEEGGICIGQGQGCANPSYVPRLEQLQADPVKGKREMQLDWSDECTQNALFYEVFRCEGEGCTSFSKIGTATTPTFRDASDQLLFGEEYRYQVRAHYDPQPAKPTVETSAPLGDLECSGRFTNEAFCVQLSTYLNQQEYLVSNFPTKFSTGSFMEDVNREFSGTINNAYRCGVTNGLSQINACSADQVCIVRDNTAQCVERTDCKLQGSSDNLFGLFFNEQTCEGPNNDPNYCFYDRSKTTVNTCYACDPSMSCYDYKSEGACGRDNCGLGSCQWKTISDELGTGVCISSAEENCRWCGQPGTQGVESGQAHNALFEACSPQTSTLLSTDEFQCAYTGVAAKTCDAVTCLDVPPSNCPSTPVQLDPDSNAVIDRGGQCGTNLCRAFNGACLKDADGDSQPDCEDEACEQDIFKPDTTVTPIISNGLLDSLSIEIMDQTHSNGASSFRTGEGYRTFFCVEPCEESHPYTASTAERSLFYSNKKLIHRQGGEFEVLLRLDQGEQSLSYYSQDPADNVGLVKSVTIMAHEGSDPPQLDLQSINNSIEVSNSRFVNGVFFSTQLEFIKVTFVDDELPVLITFASLVDEETGTTYEPSFSTSAGTSFELTFPQNIPEGEYTFEMSARSEGGVFMSPLFEQPIVVDNGVPALLSSAKPAAGSTVKTTPVQAELPFDRRVEVISITEGTKNFTDRFQTTDNKLYRGTITLEDGNKQLKARVKSFSGVEAEPSLDFVLNAKPLRITLLNPRFGVAQSSTIDLTIGTDNNANCRYGMDAGLVFETMQPFSSTGGTEHSVPGFSRLGSPGETTKIHVRCRDPETGEEKQTSFDILVDDTPPSIQEAFADPNPVAEDHFTTTLHISTDEEARCRYAETEIPFDQMSSTFPQFEEGVFRTANKQQITVEGEGSYRFYVACENKALLASQPRPVTFDVNLAAALVITPLTPPFHNSSSILLSVKTNKKTQCKYGTAPTPGSSGAFFGNFSYVHTSRLGGLQSGSHTYFVACVDGTQFSQPVRIDFTIDTTAPVVESVNDSSTLPDRPDFAWQTDSIRVRWNAVEKESEVASVFFRLTELGNATTIIERTRSLLNNEWLRITEDEQGNDLNLTPGKTYLFSVEAQNNLGLISQPVQSDGVTIDPSLKPGTCSNGEKDEDESDLDCGINCDACDVGQACIQNADCGSGFCDDNVCAAPTCADGVRNQDETSVDCGGSACDACPKGERCVLNSDCATGFCSFGTCSAPDACHDGKLSPGEADVDCGGPCQEQCSEGKSCDAVSDCSGELQCIDSKCVFCGPDDADCNGIPDSEERPQRDIGIPTDWLIENGLDPSNPFVGSEDPDGDGLTNQEEYDYDTDPNSMDSDGDGASDYEEILAGTDPTDPGSKPSSGLMLIILIALAVLITLGGGGYAFYIYYLKGDLSGLTSLFGKKETPSSGFGREYPPPSSPLPRQTPVPARPLPQQQRPKQDQEVSSALERYKKRHEKERKERESIFGNFGLGGAKDRPAAEKKADSSPGKGQDSGNSSGQEKTGRAGSGSGSPSQIKLKLKVKQPEPKEEQDDLFKKLSALSEHRKSTEAKRPDEALRELAGKTAKSGKKKSSKTEPLSQLRKVAKKKK